MNPPPGQKTPHILILDDDTAHQELCLRAFRDDPERYRVSIAGSLREARAVLERDPPDLIIADWVLPEGKGLDILPRTDGMVTIPLIIMTSFGDERLAVEIMKSGAIDYVVKSATMFRDLPHIARRALRDWENIRERKRAEAEVRDSEKRIADIIDFLPDAVLAIDDTGTVIAWNNAIEQMTGVAATDMLGKGDHEYSIPFYGVRRPILIDLVLMDDAEIEKKYDYIQRNDGRITSETFIPTLFGGIGGYLWGTASPLFDTAGNRIGAIEVIRDITERKRSEELLLRREATLETLLNAPTDTIALLDRQGIIIRINADGALRLGGTVNEVTGLCAYDRLPPDVAKVRKGHIDRVFETGKPAIFDDERSGIFLHNEVFPVFNPERTAVDHIAIFARDVTEYKRAELALQESERKYRFLIENVHDIVWQTLPDLTFTYISPAVEPLTGYSSSELVGTSLFSILTESSAQTVRERLRERMEEYSQGSRDLASVFEVEIKILDGSTRWFEVSANAVFGPDESITGFQGVARDISERKRVEMALIESETRFRDLFSNMSSGVVIYEPTPESKDFIIRDLNHAVETIEQVKKEEILGRSILEVFPGVVDFGLFAVLQRVAGTGIAESHPISMYRDDRIAGWRENYIYKLPSGEVVALYEDVTAKKLAEEALKESEGKYRALVENSGTGIVIIDRLGTYLFVNTRAAGIMGAPPEDIIGKTMFDFLPEETAQRYLAWNCETMDSGNGREYEDSFELRTGKRSFFIIDQCLKDSAGRCIALQSSSVDITERKQVEEKLRESEERFRTMAEWTYDWEYWIDTRRCVVYVSPSVERITGYPPDAFVADPNLIDRIVHPDDRGIWGSHAPVHSQKESGNEPTKLEFRIVTRYGETRWIGHVCRSIHSNDGAFIGRRISNSDITERTLAEQVRKAYESRLDSAMEIGSLAWWEMDLPDGAVRFDDRKATMLGYLPGQFKHYTDFTALLHPDDLKPAMQAMKDHLEDRQSRYHVDYRIRTANGDYRWFRDVGGITRRHPDGSPKTVTGIVIDITAEKQSEEARIESEERLRLAMEGADVASWDWDLTTGKAVFSDRFYTMLDYPPGEFPATYEGWIAHMHPEDRERVLPNLWKQIAEKRPLCEIEYRLLSKDGDWLWVLGRGKLADFNEKGTPTRMTGVNIDITNRRLMESEIRSLNTVLEQRIKDRTEALSTANMALEEENAQRLEAETKLQASYDEKVMLLKEIHHRVKNNLQIIASLLNLQSRYIKDEQTLAAIRESQNRVKAMALVHEKLYRSEDISHISLHEYIKFLGTGLFQFYDAKVRGIQFTLDIHDVDVDIDAAIPLGLIINELISNSLKYAFPDGRRGEIAISVKKEGHTMTVLYRDTGIGIPAELNWRDTPSLGLRLVNTLVDQMNGTVELDLTSGTQFTMVVHEKEQRG
jgi:PAS domain S-box-containing protein